MHHGWAVGVIIPARDEANHIASLIVQIPQWVDAIICVDDESTDNTREVAMKAAARKKDDGWGGLFHCINNSSLLGARGEKIRTGVGASIDNGQQKLLELAEEKRWADGKPWLTVIMDGDGQMDPLDLPVLVAPIIKNEAEMTKGNRRAGPQGFGKMPMRRRLGTVFLKHLTNLASGRKLEDPQCGYVALSHTAIKEWDFSKRWDGYGYPNHRILMSSDKLWRITEIPVSSIYEGQKSGVKIWRFLPKVACLLWSGLMKRGSQWYICQPLQKLTHRSKEGEGQIEARKPFYPIQGMKEILLSTAFFFGWISLGIGGFFLYRGDSRALLLPILGIVAFWLARLADKIFIEQKLLQRHYERNNE
jgi:glycosyltransferase involved in cell wall biosynthesis